jgi:hypothetical protein
VKNDGTSTRGELGELVAREHGIGAWHWCLRGRMPLPSFRWHPKSTGAALRRGEFVRNRPKGAARHVLQRLPRLKPSNTRCEVLHTRALPRMIGLCSESSPTSVGGGVIYKATQSYLVVVRMVPM